MSKTLTPVAVAAMILVTALVTVEHDREKHIPGVLSGPNAETFLVPEHVAESLIKAGAVKRAEVVDADALASVVDTSVLGGNTATSLVTTFADVSEMVEADKLRAQLADATAARDNLIEQLADTQEQLAEVTARLAAADVPLTLTPTASTDTGDVGTLVAEVNATPGASTDVAAADAVAATADTSAADAAPAADADVAATDTGAAAATTTATATATKGRSRA
jgi:hypothetical protein